MSSFNFKEILGRRPFIPHKVSKYFLKHLIIEGSLYSYLYIFSAHFMVSSDLVLVKKDVSLLRKFREVTLACSNFKSSCFGCWKSLCPLKFWGARKGGVWTIFLVMDHFFGYGPFEKSCYRHFFGFFARFLRLLQQWEHLLSTLVS